MNKRLMPRLPAALLPLWTLLTSSVWAAPGQAQPAPEALVATSKGVVIGSRTGAVESFLGIPYAEPPIGQRRWQAPVPAEPWAKPRQATALPPVCPQTKSPAAVVGSVKNEPLVGAEDCLYLNVHRPMQASKKPLPVMVWIHGGGFLNGSGGGSDGSVLAEREGVIVVTVNYRLGALGFLAHPQLSAESPLGASGNYGLQDQQLALRWTHDEIARFGGDPDQVTVFGQSAGAMSVCDHLTSPSAAGLFQRAILQSGTCVNGIMTTALATAEAVGRGLAGDLGCGKGHQELACLRQVSADDIVRLSSTITGRGEWTPVYGDALLPEPPEAALRAGRFLHVPLLTGTTHDEGQVFAFMYALSRIPYTAAVYEAMAVQAFGPELARLVLSQYSVSNYGAPLLAYAAATTDGRFSCPLKTMADVLLPQVPLYLYEFNDQAAVSKLPPVPELPSLGAYHSSDLVYVLQTPSLVADPAQMNPAQWALSTQMMAAWGAFARTGRPTAIGVVAWPAYTGADATILQLQPSGARPAVGFSSEHRCGFWRQLGLAH